MDDQFTGRTDDDLFADDFEPALTSENKTVNYDSQTNAQDVSNEPSAPATDVPDAPPTAAIIEPPAATRRAPMSLSQSRHNRPTLSSRLLKASPTNGSSSNPASSPNPHAPSSVAVPSSKEANSGNDGNSNDRPNANARLQSGANPRTKLTDEELAAKMEKMRVLSAEKARKFEQAQRDESEHAAAYARGMEEGRRRRAADEERRCRDDEERRRMDEERARNRERKLQAMYMKDGGWDQGKEHRLREEQAQRVSRGANDNIKDASELAGVSGDRYTVGTIDRIRDRGNSDDDSGDKGNRAGHGRGKRGRGGQGPRGGYADGDWTPRTQKGVGDKVAHSKLSNQHLPTVEDFPALPLAPPSPKTMNMPKATSGKPLSPPALSPSVGKWDDEMAAIDAKARS